MHEEMAQLQRAEFTIQSGDEKGTRIPIHFNPVSLQYSIENTLESGSGNAKKQYVSQSTGKLALELIFDTTDEGNDVRQSTNRIAQFMEPDDSKVPPIILFEWGTYTFQGMVDSFKETLDFFAPNGVPLRSSVSLTLSKQDKVFEANTSSRFNTQRNLDAVSIPAAGPKNATDLATQAGDARAGRAIAAANNLESMRFPSGPITIGSSVQLGPPTAFSTGSFGFGGGLSFGASISSGGTLSAGVTATQGAFAGLRTSAQASMKLSPDRLTNSATIGSPINANAGFQVGGQTRASRSSSLKADVGANTDFKTRLQFDR